MQKIISLIVSAAVASAIQVTDGSNKKVAPKARDILACMIGAALTKNAKGMGEMPGGDYEIPDVCLQDTFDGYPYGDCDGVAAAVALGETSWDYFDGTWNRDADTGCRACDVCTEYGSCVEADPCAGLVGSEFPNDPALYVTCEILEAGYELPGGDGGDGACLGDSAGDRFYNPDDASDYLQCYEIEIDYDFDKCDTWYSSTGYTLGEVCSECGACTDGGSGGDEVNCGCGLGEFCNYEEGTTGDCESCFDFFDAAHCRDDGLPDAGAEACVERCFGDDGENPGDQYVQVCGCEEVGAYFCNYDDGAESDRDNCEPCSDFADRSCYDSGLPDEGKDDCNKWCKGNSDMPFRNLREGRKH